MKKLALIILVLAVAFGSSRTYAQGAPKPIFGAKGGLNFANIGGETDNKLKTAFHAGVYSEVFFDYFLMMQMELLLSIQGHAADPAQTFSSSLNLVYLTLPIMARYNLGYNFNVHAGVQFGFLMSAKTKFTDSTTGDKITTNVKDQLKGLDIGIPVGVGYDFMDRKFSASIRYIFPISNINNTGSIKQTNSVFQVSLGIKLFTMDDL
jgi:Outer membrane protein beta-barrel domain